jgi:hypothetical protein
MLAMVVNDDVGHLTPPRGDLTFIASVLAPKVDRV